MKSMKTTELLWLMICMLKVCWSCSIQFIDENWIEKRTFLNFVMITESACLLVFSLNTWVLTIVLTIECEIINEI